MKRLAVLALLIPQILCAQSPKIETDPSSIEQAVPGAVCENYKQGIVLCQNRYIFVAMYEDEAMFMSLVSNANPERPVVNFMRTIANGNEALELGGKRTKAVKSIVLEAELHCGVVDEQKRRYLNVKSTTIHNGPFATGESYFLDHEDYMTTAERVSGIAHIMQMVCPKGSYEDKPLVGRIE